MDDGVKPAGIWMARAALLVGVGLFVIPYWGFDRVVAAAYVERSYLPAFSDGPASAAIAGGVLVGVLGMRLSLWLRCVGVVLYSLVIGVVTAWQAASMTVAGAPLATAALWPGVLSSSLLAGVGVAGLVAWSERRARLWPPAVLVTLMMVVALPAVLRLHLTMVSLGEESLLGLATRLGLVVLTLAPQWWHSTRVAAFDPGHGVDALLSIAFVLPAAWMVPTWAHLATALLYDPSSLLAVGWYWVRPKMFSVADFYIAMLASWTWWLATTRVR